MFINNAIANQSYLFLKSKRFISYRIAFFPDSKYFFTRVLNFLSIIEKMTVNINRNPLGSLVYNQNFSEMSSDVS